MANHSIAEETMRAALAALERAGGNISQAARDIGMNRVTFTNHIDKARARGITANTPVREVPLPPDDIPTADVIEMMVRRFKHRHEHKAAKRWGRFTVPSDGPYALMFFGDPHVDDDGCNWGLLQEHCNLARDTKHLYAVSVGDQTNNWTGRLAKLYAEQETSLATAHKLVRWLLVDSGVPWWLWIHGNHDCLTYDHEVLTRRGWLTFDQVQAADEVVGINPETGNREWQPINALVEAEAEGVLESQSVAFSLQCTANHRVFGRSRLPDKQWGGLEYRNPLELPSRYRIPLAAEGGNPDYPIEDDMLRLIGWVMTDGSYDPRCNRVTIYQSKDATELRRVLQGAGVAYTEATRTRDNPDVCGVALKSSLPEVSFGIAARDGARIRALLPSKLAIPDWVYDLSTRQFAVLLSAIIDGDGSRYKHTADTSIIYGRKAFLDGLQAACVLHGWRAYLSQDNRGHYRLNVSRRAFADIERGQTPWVAKTGKVPVWCLRVPLGNFLTRRDGKAHFTGNSWANGIPIIEGMNVNQVVMEDWQAKCTLVAPGGHELRLWIAHNFPGTSQWNKLHGPQRAAQMQDWAHLYVAGHHHNWALHNEEHDHRGFVYWLLRCRGYKHIDTYADHLGYGGQEYGSSIVAVVDPAANKLNAVTCFADPHEGVDFLKFKRRRA